MEKVNLLENKALYNILAISGILLLVIAFLFDTKCLFKTIFSIPCPSCGLTRGFIAILGFKFIDALNYNLLSIPIFISGVLFYFFYVIFIFLKKDYIHKFYNFYIMNYKLVIILLLLSWIVNIVKYLYDF